MAKVDLRGIELRSSFNTTAPCSSFCFLKPNASLFYMVIESRIIWWRTFSTISACSWISPRHSAQTFVPHILRSLFLILAANGMHVPSQNLQTTFVDGSGPPIARFSLQMVVFAKYRATKISSRTTSKQAIHCWHNPYPWLITIQSMLLTFFQQKISKNPLFWKIKSPIFSVPVLNNYLQCCGSGPFWTGSGSDLLTSDRIRILLVT